MSRATLALTLDGTPRSAEVEARSTLAEALRRDFGVTGLRVGCANGDCGSCTARVDGACVKTCLMLALRADGADVATLQGLADGEDLHPVQQAFLERRSFQCGFCLPGMVLASIDLLARCPRPTEEQARAALAGSLCRCTGYHDIVRGVLRAAELLSRRDEE